MTWSHSEKQLARAVFEVALEAELAELVAEFKRRAAAVSTAEEMWPFRRYLERTERDLQAKYDYRYSQLTLVFGRLLREGRITEGQIEGLSEEKLQHIRLVANL